MRPRLTAAEVVASKPARRKRERPSLAGARLLVEFAFVLGAGLAAVFPTRQQYAEFADDESPNAYSIAYLHVLTRADPQDMHLHLLYARHLQALGRFDDALLAVDPVLDDAVLGADARDLRFELLLARARAIPEGDPGRAIAFHSVADELAKMAELPENKDELVHFAGLAVELDEPLLAAKYYSRAAESDQSHRSEYLAAAGKWLRAGGDGVGAANAYKRAAENERSPELARQDRMLALDALLADNRAGEACDLAISFSKAAPGDLGVLARAVTLASAANRVLLARDLGRTLLATDPENGELMLGQATRELAAGDPAAALPLISKLRERHPDDAKLRELEAHVAEWSGKPEMALDDWLWLLDHGYSGPR